MRKACISNNAQTPLKSTRIIGDHAILLKQSQIEVRAVRPAVPFARTKAVPAIAHCGRAFSDKSENTSWDPGRCPLATFKFCFRFAQERCHLSLTLPPPQPPYPPGRIQAVPAHVALKVTCFQLLGPCHPAQPPTRRHLDPRRFTATSPARIPDRHIAANRANALVSHFLSPPAQTQFFAKRP